MFQQKDFCQQISNFQDHQRQIIFWQYDKHSFKKTRQICKNMTFGTLKYWIGTKSRAHKLIFTALGTFISRKLGHSLIYQKVTGNNTGQPTVIVMV